MGSFNGKSTSNGRCQLQSLVGLVLCFQGIMGWRCVTLTWVKLSDFTFSHEKIRLQHVFLRNHIFLCEGLGASLRNSNSTIVPVSSAQKPLDDEMWVEFGWNCCAFPGQRKLKVCVAGSSLKGVSQMKEMFGSHNIVTERRRLQSGTFGGDTPLLSSKSEHVQVRTRRRPACLTCPKSVLPKAGWLGGTHNGQLALNEPFWSLAGGAGSIQGLPAKLDIC